MTGTKSPNVAFLKALAGRLDVAATTGETTGLAMVASPRALGMTRSDYSAAVRKALHGEVHKDLVKMPVHEIEKQLLA
jgi:protein required for attachment to host cells